MSDLERLELILRRIAAKRVKEHQAGQRSLNLDIQELLTELADEIARPAHSARTDSGER